MLMVPAVGFRLPASRLKSVVLPAPLGPIRPSISPRLKRDRHAVDGAQAAETP